VFGALGGLPHRLKCWCGRGLAARPTPSAAVTDSQSVKTRRRRWPARLRCRQEDQRPQAAYYCRYLRTAAGAAQPSRRRPGQGRRVPILKASRKGVSPFITTVFADAAYAGERIAKATCIRLEIRRPKRQAGSPWSPGAGSCKDLCLTATAGSPRVRAQPHSAETFLYAAFVMLLVRHLGRSGSVSTQPLSAKFWELRQPWHRNAGAADGTIVQLLPWPYTRWDLDEASCLTPLS
jgi:hypothetical protein